MEKQLIIPQGTDVENMIIAPAVRIGDLLFLSGTTGYDREQGKLAGEDIESQMVLTLKFARSSTASQIDPNLGRGH